MREHFSRVHWVFSLLLKNQSCPHAFRELSPSPKSTSALTHRLHTCHGPQATTHTAVLKLPKPGNFLTLTPAALPSKSWCRASTKERTRVMDISFLQALETPISLKFMTDQWNWRQAGILPWDEIVHSHPRNHKGRDVSPSCVTVVVPGSPGHDRFLMLPYIREKNKHGPSLLAETREILRATYWTLELNFILVKSPKKSSAKKQVDTESRSCLQRVAIPPTLDLVWPFQTLVCFN